MSKLIIIDGNSLLFRAYFAMRPMVTSKGIHTQGVFAFINMLSKIISDNEPDYMAVAFDMKEKTFRHEFYPEYKAGRQQTPIELLSEIPYMHRVLEAMNIAILEMPRYEADDLIGTVARKASEEGFRTRIISSDKDELQLIDENTDVLLNRKGMSEFDIYNIDAMKERYNLTPSQFIDLKGLMGDSSDNIPGIPGIGEKKGIALLEKYGSLEEVLAHSDEIPGKMGENVRNNIDLAVLSKKLATIDVNAPIEFEWNDLLFREPDTDKLIEVYTELEFYKFISKLKAERNGEDTTEEASFVDEIPKANEIGYADFLSKHGEGSDVVISIESDNNHLDLPEITGIKLLSCDGFDYASLEVTPMNTEPVISEIQQKKWNLIAYDIKKIQYAFKCYCSEDLIPKHDIMIAEYLLDPNRNKYEFSKLVLRHTGNTISEFTDSEFLIYVYLIMVEQQKLLKEKQLLKLFDEIEMPLTTCIADMEKEGISCSKDTLSQIGDELSDGISKLEESIYEEAGGNFNINSPRQLASVLFEKLEIPYPGAKGKKTSYSTAADILEKLEMDYPIVSHVLEYRKLTKLKSTYVDGLIALIAVDGKIHPHFMQTVAATGRLSCIEPNLQNIPMRDEYGRSIRKAFNVSSKDNIFVGSDYSQIELRVLASLSHDSGLIDAFNNGVDIHTSTASRIFNLPLDEVTPNDRTKAKAVNFGVVYGMSAHGLSESLHISRAEAQKYIDDYFEKHTAVKTYLDNLVAEGETSHMVSTMFGRIRQIPEFASRKHMERELAKRLAMNTPIQGTAADIIKIAMNSVYRRLKDEGLKSKLILQIHDELIIEGPLSEKGKIIEVLAECMENAVDMDVKLVCDIHDADNWYYLK